MMQDAFKLGWLQSVGSLPYSNATMNVATVVT